MILVDDRVGAAEIAPLLNNSHVICRLEFADFVWAGNGANGSVGVGVERKRLLDLLQSMTTGRLSSHQMVGLIHDYDWVYLLVEGIWRPNGAGILERLNRNGRWTTLIPNGKQYMAREVWNFLNTLQIMCGVMVIQTANEKETAKWLDAAHGWWQKKWNSHKSHLRFQQPHDQYAQLAKPNLTTKVAAQFGGVGWDKAHKLGAHFPSPTALLSASKEELIAVEGVGTKIADQIIKERDEK